MVIKVLELYLDSPGFDSRIQTFFDHIRGLDSSSFVDKDELRLMPLLSTILDDYVNMLETMDENEIAQRAGIDRCIRRVSRRFAGSKVRCGVSLIPNQPAFTCFISAEAVAAMRRSEDIHVTSATIDLAVTRDISNRRVIEYLSTQHPQEHSRFYWKSVFGRLDHSYLSFVLSTRRKKPTKPAQTNCYSILQPLPLTEQLSLCLIIQVMEPRVIEVSFHSTWENYDSLRIRDSRR
jgi:hypothetical protein